MARRCRAANGRRYDLKGNTTCSRSTQREAIEETHGATSPKVPTGQNGQKTGTRKTATAT